MYGSAGRELLYYIIRDTHSLPRERVGHVHEAEVISETLPRVYDVHPMFGPQAVLHTDELLEVLHTHSGGTLQVTSVRHLQQERAFNYVFSEPTASSESIMAV
jgi:hypothetical protein